MAVILNTMTHVPETCNGCQYKAVHRYIKGKEYPIPLWICKLTHAKHWDTCEIKKCCPLVEVKDEIKVV